MGSDDLLAENSFNSGKKRFKNKEKRGSSSKEIVTQPARMRRDLHTIPLSPPDYTVPSTRTLIDDYIEKEVQYVASIPNVPFSVNPTRRTDILRVLDNARQHNFVTDWSANQDAIFSFSAREIKLLKRDSETVILREVVHNIAAVSYIHDSGRHLIFVKTGTGGMQQPEHCRLIVCACTSKERAEEVCSIIQQIFEVVYTELTIASFEESMKLLCTPSIDGSHRSHPSHRRSSDNLHSDHSPSCPHDCSCRDQANSLIVLLKEYIEQIKRRLTEAELRRFGQILQVYKSNQDLKTFCFDLHRLYGKEREDLIPGIRPYIPDRDIAHFDSFLAERGIQTSYWPDQKTPSETSSSTLGPDPFSYSEIDDGQEHDRHLLGHMHTVEQLERNIDS